MVTILVVDDDHDICDLLQFKLEIMGYAVAVVHDGQAAMAALEQEPVDLVLLDWMMPRMGGLEVCQAIRADQRFVQLPVFLLTAKAQAADVELGLAAGADDFISKPFSPADVAARVGAGLSRGRR